MSRPSIEGYSTVRPPGRRDTVVVVRDADRARFFDHGLHEPAEAVSRLSVQGWTSGGRAPHPIVEVEGGPWVVKSYRRGGWIARCNRDLYFGSRRFYRELEVCAQAARAGVPLLAPIALVVRHVGLTACRAWSISPFVPDAITLAALVESDLSLEVLLRAARSGGEATRKMHEAGIDHPDLNLQNILLRPDEPSTVWLLDWDRARETGARPSVAFKNLLRLLRSGLKLRAEPARLAAAVRSFLRGYFQVDRAALRSFREYYRAHGRREIAIHRWLWSTPLSERARHGS